MVWTSEGWGSLIFEFFQLYINNQFRIIRVKNWQKVIKLYQKKIRKKK